MSEDGIKLKAIKLGLLGDSTVGKTSICQSLMNIEFTGDNIITVGFEKLDTKFNQPYKTKTPRLINNNIIFTLTENDQKDKLLRKIPINCIKYYKISTWYYYSI